MSNATISQSPRTTTSPLKVAVASFVGTAIEWYDYFIYGSAAAIVFGPLFFPSFEPLAATLAAFATFSVGFVARPLGGIVMGHFGDRVGRKKILVLSLLIAGLATFAIGLLPTFETIGIWAPVLLVTLRFIQGFGVGGEWGGAVLLATEHAPAAKRNFFGSFPQMGVPAGVILANIVFLTVSRTLSEEAFLSWGWRIPFLLSAVLVVVGLIIRVSIDESPTFESLRTSDSRSKNPLLEVIRTQPRQIFLAIASFIGNNTLGYILVAYLLSYTTSVLGFDRNLILGYTIAAAVVWLIVIPLSSALADRVGRRPVLVIGSIALVVWALAVFPLVNTRTEGGVLTAMIGLAIVLGVTYGPIASLFSDLFAPRVRYSGASLSYQFGAILGGGLAPTLAVALFAATQSTILITVYVGVVTTISLIAITAATRKGS